MPVLEKVAPAGKSRERTMMTPKELLDTMLGYLGFVVQIDETQNEGGNLDAADLHGGKPHA